MKKFYWYPGDRARIAKRVKITPQKLSDILHRRRGVSEKRAKRLSKACRHFGYVVTARNWLSNDITNHPAFFGKPIKKRK